MFLGPAAMWANPLPQQRFAGYLKERAIGLHLAREEYFQLYWVGLGVHLIGGHYRFVNKKR